MANDLGIPIIPHETAVYLDFLLGLYRPTQILEIGTLDPKSNTTRNEENSKAKDINKDRKTESIKGKLPSTGISQINTFIAGVFAFIIAGVLTIFKRKKR